MGRASVYTNFACIEQFRLSVNLHLPPHPFRDPTSPTHSTTEFPREVRPRLEGGIISINNNQAR